MNYKTFMQITDKWSDNDKIVFLMNFPFWNEAIMRFIMHQWRDEMVQNHDIAVFANDYGIMHYTNLPTEE